VASTSAPLDTEAILNITEGTEVEHARFGKGKVIKIEGQTPNLKATVFFPTAGPKQLLLKIREAESDLNHSFTTPYKFYCLFSFIDSHFYCSERHYSET